MCVSSSDYAACRVYERLVASGTNPERAAGVARKVAARYHRKRLERSLVPRRDDGQVPGQLTVYDALELPEYDPLVD